MQPEQIKIAITCSDGSLAVMCFIVKEFNRDGTVRWERKADAEAINAEIEKAGIAAAEWRIVTDEDLPESREFREAWKDEGNGKLSHDMPKVRGIHLERLRAQRNKLIEAEDVEFTKALGKKDQKKADEVEAKRQKLRDVPVTAQPLLEAAQTVEEVKAITIETLTA